MAKFGVIVRRDAWINYTATIEAETAEAAAELALKAWKTGNPAIKFEEDGISEFDDVTCDAGDCEQTD